MINFQLKAHSIKHLVFGIKLGRDKSLYYETAGFMSCSSGLQPCRT
jgi:hypothetical protein